MRERLGVWQCAAVTDKDGVPIVSPRAQNRERLEGDVYSVLRLDDADIADDMLGTACKSRSGSVGLKRFVSGPLRTTNTSPAALRPRPIATARNDSLVASTTSARTRPTRSATLSARNGRPSAVLREV